MRKKKTEGKEGEKIAKTRSRQNRLRFGAGSTQEEKEKLTGKKDPKKSVIAQPWGLQIVIFDHKRRPPCGANE